LANQLAFAQTRKVILSGEGCNGVAKLIGNADGARTTLLQRRIKAVLDDRTVNKFLWAGAASDGMTSQATQQGGMRSILTTLILTAPPMAAMWFQGTLGGFSAYSQIGGAGGAPGPQGQPPGSYTPPQTKDTSVAQTNT
jgi:hypothetical protein